MDSIENMAYTMPAFDRVRENFLKKVDDELRNKSSPVTTVPMRRNMLCRSISSLGYPQAFAEKILRDFCAAYHTTLDGNEATVDFMRKLFQQLVQAHVEIEAGVQHYSNEKSEQPFQWPLVDMAEFEFGRDCPPLDMKKVIVITLLPQISSTSTSMLKELIKNMLHKIGKIQSIYIPIDARAAKVKGCAFVEMGKVSEGWHAYEALDGFSWPNKSGAAQDVVFGDGSINSGGTAFTLWRVQMFKNYNRRSNTAAVSRGDVAASSSLLSGCGKSSLAATMATMIVPQDATTDRRLGEGVRAASGSESDPQSDSRAYMCQRLLENHQHQQAGEASESGEYRQRKARQCDVPTDRETGNDLISHISRQLTGGSSDYSIQSETHLGQVSSSQHTFSVSHRQELEDSVVISLDAHRLSSSTSSMASGTGSSVPRGNLRPSEVLAITSVSKSNKLPLLPDEQATDGCYIYKRSVDSAAGGGVAAADDIDDGSCSDDDNGGFSDADSHSHSHYHEESDDESEDFSAAEALHTNRRCAQSTRDTESVQSLVSFLMRLKTNMTHTLLSDTLSAPSLDEMWTEANRLLARSLQHNSLKSLIQAEHQYTLALMRCIPCHESDILSSTSDPSSPLLPGRRTRHQQMGDDILGSEGQPHTPFNTIASLLETSMNDMSETAVSGGSDDSCDEDCGGVVDIHVTIATLRCLAMAAWICRSEQRVEGLKRLYHQKAARVEECENHLEMALSRARQYNNQMQKMQRRMDELQESLSYHRVAADRIRSLEGLLAEAERDRDEALDTQSSLERKLKRTQSLIQQQQQQQQQRQQQQQQERELRDSTTRGGRDGRGRQFGRDDNEMRRSDEFDVRRTPRVVRELSSFSTDDWSTLSIEQLSKIEAYMSSLSSTVQDAKEIVFQRQAKEQDAQRRDETENALCCVCRDNNKTVLLLPCKHLCLCEVCSEHISTRRMTSCPVCRQAVSDALRVYI